MRGRRGPLLQGSTQGCSNIPRVFGTSTENLAIDRPSFCLAMVYFCFVFYFTDCMMSKCYLCLMYHMASVLMVRMRTCARFFYLCIGDIMHGVNGVLSVYVYMYLLLQCFVFIVLLTYSEDQWVKISLFFLLSKEENLGIFTNLQHWKYLI